MTKGAAKRTVELLMLGREDERGSVQVREGECPFCAFVMEHVEPEFGGVCFVAQAADRNDIRRVEFVAAPPGFDTDDGFALLCRTVTSKQASDEMAVLESVDVVLVRAPMPRK